MKTNRFAFPAFLLGTTALAASAAAAPEPSLPVPPAELHVSPSQVGSTCCFNFVLSQEHGGPGDISKVTATVLTPDVKVTFATNPWTFAAFYSDTEITWFIPGTHDPYAGPQTVQACFEWSNSQFSTATLQFVGYDDQGNSSSLTTKNVQIDLASACYTGPPITYKGMAAAQFQGPAPVISSSGEGEPDDPFRMIVAGTNPGSLAFLMFGDTQQALGLPLPLDVSLLFADSSFSGCFLYQSAAITLGTVTGVDGTAEIPIAIPSNPAHAGSQIGAQWLTVDPATAGLGFSALGTITLGG